MRRLLFPSLLVALAATFLSSATHAQTCPQAASDTYSKIVANLDGVCAATQDNSGAVAGSNTTVKEYGAEGLHKTVITFTARAVTCTDEAGVVLHCGTKVYDLPDGVIVFHGASFDGTVTGSGNLSATADGDIGVGTVTASNNATLSSTEQTIIPTTPIAQLVGSTGPADAASTAATPVLAEGWSSADVDVYLNVLWDDADHDGGGFAITGTLVILWSNLNEP
jgi:hypothetical protein